MTTVGAMNLGRSKDYQPEQPIYYSHTVHAGVNQINCQYCHTGTYQGKQATLPSVNVCMNCHKGIQTGPQYGEKEIAKIYKANWGTKWFIISNPMYGSWQRILKSPQHEYLQGLF